MSRRSAAAEREPHVDQNQESGHDADLALAKRAADEPEAATQRRPERAPMSPEMLFETKKELGTLEDQLEQNQEELRELLQAKGKGSDMERVATLTKESIALSGKIAKLQLDLRQQQPAPEYKTNIEPKKKLEADPVAKMEQRLRVLAEDLGMTKSEVRKGTINTEVEKLITALAKEQGVSTQALRANFDITLEDASAKATAKEIERENAARARKEAAEEAVRDKKLGVAADQMRSKRGEHSKQTQRLEALAKQIGQTTSSQEKKTLLEEANALIPVLAKAQGVSEAALRADFSSAQELSGEGRAKDLAKRRETAQTFASDAEKGLRTRQAKAKEDNEIADQATKEFRKTAEAQKFRPKLKEAALNLTNIVDLEPGTVTALWSDFEQAAETSARLEGKSVKDIEREALRPLTRVWGDQKRETKNEGLQKALAELMLNPRAYIERIRVQDVSEKFKTRVRKNLEGRKDERETYQTLHEEMRQITEQKDPRAMAAFYESLKRLADDEKSPKQAAAAKLLEELTTETKSVAKKQERQALEQASEVYRQQMKTERDTNESKDFDQELEAGWNETGLKVAGKRLGKEIKNEILSVEEDYFRQQSQESLTPEELREVGLSGKINESGWKSADKRAEGLEQRKQLMIELNAITWKIWQAPGIRRKIAEIDRNEAAFQADMKRRLPKKTSQGSVRRLDQRNNEERSGGGIFPRG